MVPPYFTQKHCAFFTLTPCFYEHPYCISGHLLQDYLPVQPALSSTNRKLSWPVLIQYSFPSSHFLYYYKQKTAVFQPLFCTNQGDERQSYSLCGWQNDQGTLRYRFIVVHLTQGFLFDIVALCNAAIGIIPSGNDHAIRCIRCFIIFKQILKF